MTQRDRVNVGLNSLANELFYLSRYFLHIFSKLYHTKNICPMKKENLNLKAEQIKLNARYIEVSQTLQVSGYKSLRISSAKTHSECASHWYSPLSFSVASCSSRRAVVT